MDAGIFKAYDVRGIYPEQINAEVAYKVGRAFARYMKHKIILVGYDSRLSSKSLKEAVIGGLRDEGKDVIDIGLSSTPMFNFACDHKAMPGIMVTASHNPKQYNGFKFAHDDANPLDSKEIQKIRKIVEKGGFHKSKPASKVAKVKQKVNVDLGIGRYAEIDVMKDYVQHVVEFANPGKLKVVVDASSGSMGRELDAVLAKFKSLNVIKLSFKADGRFPDHGPNPMKDKNIKKLQTAVRKKKADLGVIFDADGDRIMFVDEKGKRITADIIMAVIAEHILKKEGPGKVLYDQRSSKVVPEVVKACKGTPVRSKVGRTCIINLMRKKHIIFGGELSGHYFYEDNSYTDSGIISMLLVFDIFSKAKKDKIKPSKYVKCYQRYFHSGEINFNVENKDAMIKKIEKEFKAGKKDHLDGLTIDFGHGWLNVRKSNTEPKLRVNVEAGNKESMKLLLAKIENIINKG